MCQISFMNTFFFFCYKLMGPKGPKHTIAKSTKQSLITLIRTHPEHYMLIKQLLQPSYYYKIWPPVMTIEPSYDNITLKFLHIFPSQTKFEKRKIRNWYFTKLVEFLRSWQKKNKEKNVFLWNVSGKWTLNDHDFFFYYLYFLGKQQKLNK